MADTDHYPSEAARLAAILEATGAALYEWNIQTGEARVNDTWAQLTGHRLADLGEVRFTTGLPYAHPDDRAAAGRIIDHALATDPTRPFDIRCRKQHAAGHWVWIQTRLCVTTTTADGRPEWLSAVQMDITDQKRKENALRKSESLLAKTGEVAGVGGWDLDLLTGAVTWTDQTCRIHGIETPYQPSLETALDFYAPESRPVIEAAVKAGMTSGTPSAPLPTAPIRTTRP